MADGMNDDLTSLRFYKGVAILVGAEIDDLPKFQVRDDDIWVCSWPRSGTTLTQEMTYLVMTLDFETAKTVNLDDRFPIADTKDLNYPYYRGLEYLASLPADKPRMIKSHFQYTFLPDDIQERKKGRIIYICRNPKAAVTSYYKLLKYLGSPPAPTLREYFEMFLKGYYGVFNGPWSKHVKDYWDHRNDGHILFLQYEHVMKDRRGTIQKIADFLGKSLADDDIDKILEHTTLENMRKNPAVNMSYIEKHRETDKTEGVFINKGLSEDWKKEVPEDIQKRVDEMIRQELQDVDLCFD